MNPIDQSEQPKNKQKQPTLEQQQSYDNVIKSLLEGWEKELLGYFHKGVTYLERLDIEVMRTVLRVDRVYRVMFRGHEHILHLEFESGSDEDMRDRLLDYHAYLHRKYKRPVISVIVYPFKTTMAVSPLVEMSGDEAILTFIFAVCPLWMLSAEQFMHEHVVRMYPLLPTMDGANARLLNQAIDEMIEYFKDDSATLAEEFKWLGVLLRRATIVEEGEKRQIQERLSMYDDLIEQDPKMRKMRAESEAKGIAIGEAKGKAEGLQEALVTVIEGRFPPLAEVAQEKVTRIKEPLVLKFLLKQINAAPDEAAVRLILTLAA